MQVLYAYSDRVGAKTPTLLFYRLLLLLWAECIIMESEAVICSHQRLGEMSMRQRLAALVVLIPVLATVAVQGGSSIRVNVDGKDLVMNQEPIVVNGRTLVPLRSIFESLGVAPEWDGSQNLVTATSGAMSVQLKIGESSALVNGKDVRLDAPATIVNGRTMVPARFIAEALGANVQWDETSRTVSIESKSRAGAGTLTQLPIPSLQSAGKKSAAPSRPRGIDSTDTTLTVAKNPLHEFSIDYGMTWQSSNHFVGLKGSTTYGIISRVKATPTSPASEPSLGTEMTTSNWRTNYLAKGKGSTDTTISLVENPELEYSIDGGKTWQTDSVFTGLEPSTSYMVLARKRGVPETTPQYGISIMTNVMSSQVGDRGPERPMVESCTSTSITLVYDSEMEYSMDDGASWQQSPVFDNLSPDTLYNFVQRYRAKEGSAASLMSDGITGMRTKMSE